MFVCKGYRDKERILPNPTLKRYDEIADNLMERCLEVELSNLYFEFQERQYIKITEMAELSFAVEISAHCYMSSIENEEMMDFIDDESSDKDSQISGNQESDFENTDESDSCVEPYHYRVSRGDYECGSMFL